MHDRLGREITYVRVSVTDRCNLRCQYCMPAAGVPFVPHARILRFEEITAAVAALARLGVRQVKLTGGEPLCRRDLPQLARMLYAVPGIEEVTLTTNGMLLPGAMFLLGYYDDGTPVMGLPGCVMYAKATVFDLVLPRIAAGVPISRRELKALGHGGLCLGCPECRYPVCPFGK